MVVDNLISELTTLFLSMRNTEFSEEEYAQQLGTIIDAYIRTAQVDAGILVATTGTSEAQTGATTSVGHLS